MLVTGTEAPRRNSNTRGGQLWILARAGDKMHVLNMYPQQNQSKQLVFAMQFHPEAQKNYFLASK